jgi:hypothetical protein
VFRQATYEIRCGYYNSLRLGGQSELLCLHGCCQLLAGLEDVFESGVAQGIETPLVVLGSLHFPSREDMHHVFGSEMCVNGVVNAVPGHDIGEYVLRVLRVLEGQEAISSHSAIAVYRELTADMIQSFADMYEQEEGPGTSNWLGCRPLIDWNIAVTFPIATTYFPAVLGSRKKT